MTNKMQLCRIIYYSLAALYVSSDIFAHHQEHLNCITVSGITHVCRCRLVSWECWNWIKVSSNSFLWVLEWTALLRWRRLRFNSRVSFTTDRFHTLKMLVKANSNTDGGMALCLCVNVACWQMEVSETDRSVVQRGIMVSWECWNWL